MFGIDVPIFAFSHCRDVVVAVSRAGGMGVLGAGEHTAEALDVDLHWIEDHIGGFPYGVDLAVPASATIPESGGQTVGDLLPLIPDAHRCFVADLLDRYDVPALDPDVETLVSNPARLPPGVPEQGDVGLGVALGYGPALVVNALGPPPPAMVDAVKAAGRRVGALAGTREHALRHVAAGVDLLVAQGSEAGGHTGEIGTVVLVPEIVDACPSVPVLAAGGIGRGRQMAAAMALGAQGVWCGSVWLTTDEAETHPVVKQKLLAAGSRDTVRSRSRTGKHSRQLRTAWTEEWESPSAPSPLPMPLQPVLVDEAIQRIERAAHRPGSGAERLVNYYVGQIVGSMNSPGRAASVVLDMVDEFIETLRGLAALLDQEAVE
ncbi:MAG: putative monooxygenase [Acidimicrobiia bacterium]